MTEEGKKTGITIRKRAHPPKRKNIKTTYTRDGGGKKRRNDPVLEKKKEGNIPVLTNEKETGSTSVTHGGGEKKRTSLFPFLRERVAWQRMGHVKEGVHYFSYNGGEGRHRPLTKKKSPILWGRKKALWTRLPKKTTTHNGGRKKQLPNIS